LGNECLVEAMLAGTVCGFDDAQALLRLTGSRNMSIVVWVMVCCLLTVHLCMWALLDKAV
jgi:hypothetical protein